MGSQSFTQPHTMASSGLDDILQSPYAAPRRRIAIPTLTCAYRRVGGDRRRGRGGGGAARSVRDCCCRAGCGRGVQDRRTGGKREYG